MTIFLLVILIAVALGIIGAVVKGLIWLLVIGVIVFLLDFVFAGTRLRRSGSRIHR
jgi:hypothetical protein